MAQRTELKSDLEKVADIIRDAGGRIVGRTRLQKLAYLRELSGLGGGFPFEYRHYGPYSEELSIAVRSATLLGLIREEERATNWGGFYSIYTTPNSSDVSPNSSRYQLAHQAISVDPIQLELAATAAFLAKEGVEDPWEMTRKLKPEKSEGDNLERAKLLYRKLMKIDTPQRLPNIM